MKDSTFFKNQIFCFKVFTSVRNKKLYIFYSYKIKSGNWKYIYKNMVKRVTFTVSEKGYFLRLGQWKGVLFQTWSVKRGTFLMLSRSVNRGTFQTLCMSMILYKIYRVGPPGCKTVKLLAVTRCRWEGAKKNFTLPLHPPSPQDKYLTLPLENK